jgi:hypothetical protein
MRLVPAVFCEETRLITLSSVILCALGGEAFDLLEPAAPADRRTI